MQGCAFDTDSKEAPFSIYTDACRYYFTTSMWMFTKILHSHRSIKILTTQLPKSIVMSTRGHENDHFAFKFIFSHVNSQLQLCHTNQPHDYLSQLLRWPKLPDYDVQA